MSRSLGSASLLAAPLALLPSESWAGRWEIDPAHTTVSFRVKHMMVTTVRGTFAKVAGHVEADDQDPARARIEVTIDAASIHTGMDKRDEHLRSADFFDVAKHPTLTFRSTKIEKTADGLRVTGSLTMRGVTRPVTLTVEDLTAPVKNPWGQTVRGLHASGKLSRKEWGLVWNTALEAGGVAVSDEVKLDIDAELVQK